VAEHVLDTSVIMAWINEEPGHEEAERYLSDAACSANTIVEVASLLAEKGADASTILENFIDFDFEVHPVGFEEAVEIGQLRLATRAAGLSLGDRSCLALAARLGLPAITADRAWAGVAPALDVEVRLIR
jgi:PIN domain nuclease of toxin-antitoxin system